MKSHSVTMSIGGHHFVEGTYVPHRSRLDDDTYGLVLDNIVVGCTDALVVNEQGEILLGYRDQFSLKGWWVFGGRMFPGESFQEAMARKLQQEISLLLRDDKLRSLHPIAINSFLFGTREQAPQNHGCHMLQVLMPVRLDSSRIVLTAHNKEYRGGLRWFDPTLILENRTGEFHPFLQQIVRDALPLLQGKRLSMNQLEIGGHHFVEGNYTPHRSRLDDYTYGQVLDNIVVGCTDALVVNEQGEILLGYRNQFPLKGWWVFGGRMFPGESFQQAMTRKLQQEISLPLRDDEFNALHPIAINSFLFGTREQVPQNHGCHMLQVLMPVRVDTSRIVLTAHNKEYRGGLRWFDPTLILENRTGEFHPFLQQIVRDALPLL